MKKSCDENIVPVLNNENKLVFLHNDKYISEENIKEMLEDVKKAKQEEVVSIKEEIKTLYNSIDDIDNEIKYKKETPYGVEVIVSRANASDKFKVSPISIEELFVFMVKEAR